MKVAGLSFKLQSRSFQSQMLTESSSTMNPGRQDLLPPYDAISRIPTAFQSQELLPFSCSLPVSPVTSGLPIVPLQENSAVSEPYRVQPLNALKRRQASRCSWLQQARGRDGRFLSKRAVPGELWKKVQKTCGWCYTSKTTQWRAGPPNSAGGMSTQVGPVLSICNLYLTIVPLLYSYCRGYCAL